MDEHQGDDGAGQVLLERQGPQHGQQRDHVDAGFTAEQTGDDFSRHRDDADHGGDGPRDVGGILLAGQLQDAAGHDPDDRRGEPDPTRVEPARGGRGSPLGHHPFTRLTRPVR